MKKVIFVIFSLMLLVGCNPNRVQHNTQLEEAIHSNLKNVNRSEIDIKSLANFTWDKAFIFSPYTSQESIDEQLGIHFKDPSNINSRDKPSAI